MSALLDAQQEFAQAVVLLLKRMTDEGYQYTFGDAYRDPRCPYGAQNSKHRQRLAIDINLFRNGVYLNKTSDHQPFGEYWESLGMEWGGRFNDGNHYASYFKIH